MPTNNHIQQILRATSEIIGQQDLVQKLSENRPLTIKAGFDPTAPDIHLGHVVLLKKLKDFQALGHRVYFLIGDFTAQIGDPTGRDQLRKKMESEDIIKNAQTYKDQVFKILDESKTEVVFNSHWLARLTPQDMLNLTARSTVAQMLARADFKKRFETAKEISLLEFIYPLLQGYDSVHLKADVELGGTDQKFNLLMGRQLQESYGQKPQVVVMTPLLEGTDGVQKMSKSLGNYIGIQEAPNDIFGKVMSISDDLMLRYYELLTDEDVLAVKKLHPKEAKLQLAQRIVEMFHAQDQGAKARAHFERTFSQRQVPEDIPGLKLVQGHSLLYTLRDTGISGNEIRRLIKEGAITHEGKVITDEHWIPTAGVLKVGKRRFFRLE